LFLRGALPNMPHADTSWRYPVVELSVGAIWGLLGWRLMDMLINTRFGFTLPYLNLEYTAGIMVFCWTLVGIATLDAKSFNLSDLVTLPGVAIGIVFYILTSEQMVWFFVTEPTPLTRNLAERLIAVVAAAGLVLLIQWVYWLIRRQKILGLGEANLMAMLAAWLGLPGALLAFGIGVLIGTVALLTFLAGRAHAGETLKAGKCRTASGHVCLHGRNRQLSVGTTDHLRLHRVSPVMPDFFRFDSAVSRVRRFRFSQRN
jgi:leader peptidase (prepilin peptidase)/N-methyltransferase